MLTYSFDDVYGNDQYEDEQAYSLVVSPAEPFLNKQSNPSRSNISEYRGISHIPFKAIERGRDIAWKHLRNNRIAKRLDSSHSYRLHRLKSTHIYRLDLLI